MLIHYTKQVQKLKLFGIENITLKDPKICKHIIYQYFLRNFYNYLFVKLYF